MIGHPALKRWAVFSRPPGTPARTEVAARGGLLAGPWTHLPTAPPERGCVRRTSRSKPDGTERVEFSEAVFTATLLRLTLRAQPRSGLSKPCKGFDKRPPASPGDRAGSPVAPAAGDPHPGLAGAPAAGDGRAPDSALPINPPRYFTPDISDLIGLAKMKKTMPAPTDVMTIRR